MSTGQQLGIPQPGKFLGIEQHANGVVAHTGSLILHETDHSAITSQ
jgi:hypothetical protein